jgi:hypothetical protein
VPELDSLALGRLLSQEEEGGILYHFAPKYQGHAASLLEQVPPLSLPLPFPTGTLPQRAAEGIPCFPLSRSSAVFALAAL